MISAELAREVFSIVEKKIASERSSMEFEMAYQMGVAGERIRIRRISNGRDWKTGRHQRLLKECLMSSDAMREFLEIVEAEVQSRPTATEFEMAYQVRVAMDRIRFAIKHTEQFGPRTDQMREAGLQLLDALGRLESAERSFQKRFRGSPISSDGGTRSQFQNWKPGHARNGAPV